MESRENPSIPRFRLSSPWGTDKSPALVAGGRGPVGTVHTGTCMYYWRGRGPGELGHSQSPARQVPPYYA
jgi:hypothetical protein